MHYDDAIILIAQSNYIVMLAIRDMQAIVTHKIINAAAITEAQMNFHIIAEVRDCKELYYDVKGARIPCVCTTINSSV